MNRLVFLLLLPTPFFLGSSALGTKPAPDQEPMVSLDFPDIRGGNGPQKVIRGQAPDSSVALRILLEHADQPLESKTVESCSKYKTELPKGATLSSLVARLLIPGKTDGPASYVGYRCQKEDDSTIRCWIDQFARSTQGAPSRSLSFAFDALNYRLRFDSLRCEAN